MEEMKAARRRRQRETDRKEATKAATRRMQRRDGDKGGTFTAKEKFAVNKKERNVAAVVLLRRKNG